MHARLRVTMDFIIKSWIRHPFTGITETGCSHGTRARLVGLARLARTLKCTQARETWKARKQCQRHRPTTLVAEPCWTGPRLLRCALYRRSRKFSQFRRLMFSARQPTIVGNCSGIQIAARPERTADSEYQTAALSCRWPSRTQWRGPDVEPLKIVQPS